LGKQFPNEERFFSQQIRQVFKKITITSCNYFIFFKFLGGTQFLHGSCKTPVEADRRSEMGCRKISDPLKNIFTTAFADLSKT